MSDVSFRLLPIHWRPRPMGIVHEMNRTFADRPTERLADPSEALARLDALARLLDSAVRIPGTDIRIGVDAAIGMVPVVGDIISHALSSYLIYEARRLGASRWLIARMAANTTLDAVVGMVPVLGDAFDVMYRANTKNIALLRAHIERSGVRVTGSGPVIDQEGNVVSTGDRFRRSFFQR